MAIPEEFKNTIDNMSTADIIRLHYLVREKFEDLKKTTPNFSSAIWATLNKNTDAIKKNNIVQQQKFRERKKQANSAIQT